MPEIVENRYDPLGLELREFEEKAKELGQPEFRARQAFEWLWQKGVTDYGLMTNLGRAAREAFGRAFAIQPPEIVSKQVSADGTTKLLLRFADGKQVEAVYIPDTPAQTFCISTQVGCAMACAFCLTGKMGLVRNLTAGEIASQVLALAHETGLASSTFNIVVMGMGEPLHNYDATMKALRILADPHGLNVRPRRVTLSTVGLIPAIEKLASEPLMPNLAISLHATTDEQRTAIVPINKKYTLAALIDACKRFPLARRQRITFEYVLLNGVNDTPADARRLVALLDAVKAKVNLLPLNEAPGIPFTRPSDARVDAFAKILADKGLIVSVRKSRGRDIRAACGQLATDSAVAPAAR